MTSAHWQREIHGLSLMPEWQLSHVSSNATSIHAGLVGRLPHNGDLICHQDAGSFAYVRLKQSTLQVMLTQQPNEPSLGASRYSSSDAAPK